MINTIATVKGFYYDLLFAIDNLAANQKNLQLAKKLLEENEIRVKVGTMAPLDVVTAQSEVASREEGVIVAENDLAQAEDDVKRLIFPQNDPLMWSTKIQPTDRATVDPGAESQVDIDAAITAALQNRTDVVAARKNLENEDYRLALAKSRKLPQLDLVANYGGAGAGGTQLIRDPPLGGPVVDTIPGSYGDAVSEVFGFDFPTWTVGFNVSYAIPNRSAKAAEAQARISKDQTLTSFRRLELQVAAEVRTAGRGVESGFKRVQSTQAARVLAAQRLDAEEKKFAAGMTTNFLVTQAQRDLAQAEVNNLRAVADYRKSVINFQRVQEAGVSGFGAVAILGAGSNNQAGQALLSAAAARRAVDPRGRSKGGRSAPLFLFARAATPPGACCRSGRLWPLYTFLTKACAVCPSARSRLEMSMPIRNRRLLIWLSLAILAAAAGWLLLRGGGDAPRYATATSTAATWSRWWARRARCRR